jgi:anti-sigma regulatory factor (Ser/Thr protein kinase)
VGTGESIPGLLRLSLSGRGAVHRATLAARNFGERTGIDEGDRTRLAIVVEELVTNLFDYGGLTDEDVFEIEFSAADARITLVLIDPGRAFDPRFVPDDDAIPSRGAGAGLKLVRTWASDIDYQCVGSRNRLAVILPRRVRPVGRA